MLIACKCLNVMLGSIASTNNDAEEGKSPTTTTFDSNQVADPNSDIFELLDAPMPVVSRAALERLTIDQINFFKTSKVSSMSAITPAIQHFSLVNVVPVDNWNMHTCRHCKSIVYAEDTNSTKLLINPQLRTNQEKLNVIRMHKNFSKSFNVLTMPATKLSNTDADTIDSRKLELKKLRKYVNDVVQSELEEAEERIDRYAKQQMALLALFREKTELDYQFILRTIYDDASNKSGGDAISDTNDITLTANITSNAKLLSDLTPPVTPDNTPMSIGNSPTFKMHTPYILISQDVNKVKQINKVIHSTPEKQLQRSNGRPNDDLFFDMDGMDEIELQGSSTLQMPQSDDEGDVDNDDSQCDLYDGNQSSAIKIQPSTRRNGPKMAIAQSLPIAVPIFNHRIEDDYEEYTERQDNLDIAASIKALAKSVHGETIFGDLPKPRFSTQI